VVSGLGASGGVAHAQQGFGGFRGLGKAQAQRLGGVGEPAVVAGSDVQGRGLGLEDPLDPAVVDEWVRVSDRDSFLTARRLACYRANVRAPHLSDWFWRY